MNQKLTPEVITPKIGMIVSVKSAFMNPFEEQNFNLGSSKYIKGVIDYVNHKHGFYRVKITLPNGFTYHESFCFVRPDKLCHAVHGFHTSYE